MKAFIRLPVDAIGRPINVGDRVYIKHNGKTRVVTSLMFCDGYVIVGCDSGGAFMLPESSYNVLRVGDDDACSEHKAC